MSATAFGTPAVPPAPATFVAAVFAMLTLAGCGVPAVSEPDPANELPFGVVDRPVDGETVGRMLEVTGWALDDSEVRLVRLYVDGKYRQSTTLTAHRSDVVAAHPTYARDDGNQGWDALIDLGDTAGPHAVLVQAVDDDGASRDIGTVVVKLVGR